MSIHTQDRAMSLIESIDLLAAAIRDASDAQLLRDLAEGVEARVATDTDRDRLRDKSNAFLTAVGALAGQIENGKSADAHAASAALTSLRGQVLKRTTGLDGWPVK